MDDRRSPLAVGTGSGLQVDSSVTCPLAPGARQWALQITHCPDGHPVCAALTAVWSVRRLAGLRDDMPLDLAAVSDIGMLLDVHPDFIRRGYERRTVGIPARPSTQ